VIFVASDHAGYPLKQAVVKWLADHGHAHEDLGTHDTESTDYPEYAHLLAKKVAETEGAKGVLVCGSGIGMSIAANRHPGIRAALCHEAYSARMTRLHNDANVLCMGSRIVGEGVALDLLEVFLGTEFEGGRHARRVGKIDPA